MKSEWEILNFDPVEPKLVEVELKIGKCNYLGSLAKRAKLQICNPPGGLLGDG